MPIAFVQPLACGAALQLSLAPAKGTQWCRVLRRTDANFAGPTDPNAVVVVDQYMLPGAVDFAGLTNGTTYYYQLYSTPDGVTLSADGAPNSGVPAVTYQDAAADPQEVLYDRMVIGLAAEVAAGNITPGPKSNGVVPVFTAPFALPDKIVFPCVTVHLESTEPGNRAIGEDVAMEFFDASGNVVDSEGWMASYSINVVGATLNPDERIAMRKALRRIIQSNLAVFDAAGMVEIGFSQSDSEQLPEVGAPVMLTLGRFTCVAPAAITIAVPPLASDVVTSVEIFA